LQQALISRFKTGSDDGIFLVRDMLTQYMGFALSDVEMIYFDDDSTERGPKRCLKGQSPPTATHFKKKFTDLLSSAKAGHICFVYVDTHGHEEEDENSHEQDGKSEGWRFAGAEDGTTEEVVNDDWVGETIRKVRGSDQIRTIFTSLTSLAEPQGRR
jgi:hypothetical protein